MRLIHWRMAPNSNQSLAAAADGPAAESVYLPLPGSVKSCASISVRLQPCMLCASQLTGKLHVVHCLSGWLTQLNLLRVLI